MAADDVIYAALLILSIPFGLIFRYLSPGKSREIVSTLAGITLILITCKSYSWHSAFTTAVNTFIISTAYTHRCVNNSVYVPLMVITITCCYIPLTLDWALRNTSSWWQIISSYLLWICMCACTQVAYWFKTTYVTVIHVGILKFIYMCAIFRHVHMYSFIWCFSYLAFFRTCHWFGFDQPSPQSNAVQLLLTLKVICSVCDNDLVLCYGSFCCR